MAITRSISLVVLMLGVSHAFVTPGTPSQAGSSYAASVAAPRIQPTVEAPASEVRARRSSGEDS
eukprot:6338049-Amphidinium_carterae.1